MKIVSTNIGLPKTISWKGKEVVTGIFKIPVDETVFLGTEDVKGDHVIDRRYHGGSDKACYLYSADHYNYWKNLYPHLDWQWGMFGENLTVVGLNEKEINIGDIYQIGEARVQVTQPRQPCYKLGVRFGSQEVVKQFIDFGNAGVYMRVIKPGYVKSGDEIILLERFSDSFSIREIFRMIYSNDFEKENLLKAISDINLAESCRNDLKKIWGI